MPIEHHFDIAAFVLAGGRSSRMGQDKAFLEFEGSSLLERSLLLARELTSEVQIVGSSAKFRGFGPVVEDEFPGHGPLGGIHAALTVSAADLNLILAVDMPFLTARFLQYLADRARSSPAVVTVPRTRDGWQPLCAIYRRAFLKLAEPALHAGRNKIDPLFEETDVSVITNDDLENAGFSSKEFRNLNTPEDVEAATRNKT